MPSEGGLLAGELEGGFKDGLDPDGAVSDWLECRVAVVLLGGWPVDICGEVAAVEEEEEDARRYCLMKFDGGGVLISSWSRRKGNVHRSRRVSIRLLFFADENAKSRGIPRMPGEAGQGSEQTTFLGPLLFLVLSSPLSTKLKVDKRRRTKHEAESLRRCAQRRGYGLPARSK